MKKIALMLLTAVGLCLSAQTARADWGTLHYGGQQPCWAFWSKHKKCNSEEEKWQRFWHDYYDALEHYYGRLEHIDWVTYYKFHGYQINGGGCGGGYGNPCCRPQFAPVLVNPSMQWAVPSGPMAPCGPGGN